MGVRAFGPQQAQALAPPFPLKEFFMNFLIESAKHVVKNIFLAFCPEIRRIEVQLGNLGVSPTDLFHAINSLNPSEV